MKRSLVWVKTFWKIEGAPRLASKVMLSYERRMGEESLACAGVEVYGAEAIR